MNIHFADRTPYMSLPQPLRIEALQALTKKEEAEASGNAAAMHAAMGLLKSVLAKVKAHQRSQEISKVFSDALHPSMQKVTF